MKLLHIESSLFADQGVSSQLGQKLVEQFKQKHPDLEIRSKRFATDPVPHLDGEVLQALMTEAEQRTESQQAKVDYADRQIEEVQWADTLVIGMPMYNFSLPSMLKAWFDYIARAGVTFRYTESGPEGLLKGKKAYVIATRGGRYMGTPTDSQTPLVTTFLNFIGITDIEFIYAEGLNMGDDHRQQALDAAHQQIQQVA